MEWLQIMIPLIGLIISITPIYNLSKVNTHMGIHDKTQEKAWFTEQLIIKAWESWIVPSIDLAILFSKLVEVLGNKKENNKSNQSDHWFY